MDATWNFSTIRQLSHRPGRTKPWRSARQGAGCCAKREHEHCEQMPAIPCPEYKELPITAPIDRITAVEDDTRDGNVLPQPPTAHFFSTRNGTRFILLRSLSPVSDPDTCGTRAGAAMLPRRHVESTLNIRWGDICIFNARDWLLLISNVCRLRLAMGTIRAMIREQEPTSS